MKKLTDEEKLEVSKKAAEKLNWAGNKKIASFFAKSGLIKKSSVKKIAR